MPTEESQLQTVPVIVTNFPSTRNTENIELRLSKLYDLFNGKDYKKRFEDVEKQIKAIQNSNILIHTLLRTYLPGISNNINSISNTSKQIANKENNQGTGQFPPIGSSTIGNSNVSTQSQEKISNSDIIENIDSSLSDLSQDLQSSLSDISQDLRNSIESLKNIVSELIQKANSDVSESSEKPSSDREIKDRTSLTTNLTGGESATREAHDNAKESASKYEEGNVNFSEKVAVEKAVTNAKDVMETVTKSQEATKKALDNAQKILNLQKRLEEDALRDQRATRDRIVSVLQGLWDTVKQSFHKVFESWDRQAAHLKEIGMGRENIIELNNITSDTMHATEDLVGWNISIDKAIQATNNMVSAGFSPKYMEENNKNLIMGLESAGLQLQPSTIRELGNAVFDATNVKELTQGWADLVAADTENRIDAQELSRYLASDDYKKYVSLAMENGATRAQADATMQQALRQAIQWGATGKDAFSMAMTQAQATHGGSAFLNIPENLSSIIGVMQTAGTFSGDLKNFTQDFAKTIKAAYNDPEIMRRIKNINVGLVASNDFTMYDNILNNKAASSGNPLHIATHEEQEAGRYESVLTRATKWFGNDVLGGIPGIGTRSIGANSQFLTGDSSFGTNFLGSLWNKFTLDLQGILDKGDKKEAYLKEIAENTSITQQVENQMLSGLLQGGGASGGVLGKGLSVITKFGPYGLAIGAAVTELVALGNTIMDGVTKISESQQEQIDLDKNAKDSYVNEIEIKQKLEKAISRGDDDEITKLSNQLQQARSTTDKAFMNQIEAENKETAGYMQMGMWAIPFMGPLLGLADTLSGHSISAKASEVWNGSSEDRLKEKRDSLFNVSGYAEGGVVTKEQLALVGEGNNPEVILPLTNTDRMGQLLGDLGILPKENNIIISGKDNNIETSIRDLISKQQSDVEKIVNILQGGLLSSNDRLGNISNLLHFAEGGIVDSEKMAVIGEGNNPEVILPLTNPVRTLTLLKEAANHPGTSKIIRDILNIKTESPFTEINYNNISDLSDKLNSLSDAHPEIIPFVSYLETSFDKLNKLSYREQLGDLQKNNIITQQEYNRFMEQSQDKLIDSLDSLNRTVQESNRMSRNSQYIPNVSSNINRRYI